jgi:hypothetical protein
MQRPVGVSDGSRVQAAGLAVLAVLAQELGAMVAQMRWLEGLELRAADGRQCVQFEQFAIPSRVRSSRPSPNGQVLINRLDSLDWFVTLPLALHSRLSSDITFRTGMSR